MYTRSWSNFTSIQRRTRAESIIESPEGHC